MSTTLTTTGIYTVLNFASKTVISNNSSNAYMTAESRWGLVF